MNEVQAKTSYAGKYMHAQTGSPSPKCSVEHKKEPIVKHVPLSKYRNAQTKAN